MRWFTTTVRRLLQGNGTTQTVTVSRDATARVLAERALVEQQALFQQVFDINEGPMALSRPDGHLIRVNSAFAAMLGRESSELLGLRVQDITYPDDLATDESNVAELLSETTAAHVVRKRYLRADGSPVAVIVHATLVRSGAESVVLAHPRLDPEG